MQLSDFYYELPNELIAQYPAKDRASSRLLCVDVHQGTMQHRQFTDLVDLLHPNDLLVFNDTFVIPARMHGEKESGGKVEVLVERILNERHALAHIRSNRSPKEGSWLELEGAVKVQVIGRSDDLFKLEFDKEQPVLEILETYGHIPLPPYIQRSDEQEDQLRYQSIFAKHKGAVAAPTASLHFDERLMRRIEEKQIETAFLTLHVGAGTFLPIRVDDIKEHKMHSEWIRVTESVCQKVAETKARGGRVIAIGTTTVRSLESAAQGGSLKPYEGDTDIFIYPGFEFKVVDAMVTNFHLPESTLMLLVSAFAGKRLILGAYQTAVQMKYRFYSYGDAMFLYKPEK